MVRLRISIAILIAVSSISRGCSKLADRSRVVKARYDSGKTDKYRDNGRAIEGQSYRSTKFQDEDEIFIDTVNLVEDVESAEAFRAHEKKQKRKANLDALMRAGEVSTQGRRVSKEKEGNEESCSPKR